MGKIIIVLAFITSFIIPGKAQVSGYMGKRFSLHYSCNVFPNVFAIEGNRDVPVYVQHVGYLSYVINRQILIEGGYAFHRSSIDLQTLVSETYYDPNQQEYTTTQTPFYDNGTMTVNEGFVNIKMFQRRRGYFPPLGRYGKFGIGIAHIKTVSSAGSEVFQGETLPNYNDVIFRVGVGRQFVIANRLTIDYGFDVSLPLLSISRAASASDLPYYSYYYGYHASTFTQNDRTAGDKMLSLYLMQLHVGLGFLAF